MGFLSPPPHTHTPSLKISTGFALPFFSSVAKFERKMQQLYFHIFNMLPPYGVWTSGGSFRSSTPGIVSCSGIPPRVYPGGTMKRWLSPAPIPKEAKAARAPVRPAAREDPRMPRLGWDSKLLSGRAGNGGAKVLWG